MGKSVDTALQKQEPNLPETTGGSSLTHTALRDANTEDIRFLQDLALELPYAEFATRGVAIQHFLRLRTLAFQDTFEDIPEELKRQTLSADGSRDPKQLRKLPEYLEMCSRFKALAETFSKPESDRSWLQRVAGRNRRNMERFARTNDPELMRDAGRAAAEILEREMPKASRAQVNLGPQIHITAEGAAVLAKAFQEANLPPPTLPQLEARIVPDEPEK